MNAYGKVLTALHTLCAAAPKPGLFTHYFSAAAVAKEAGVSESTARKYLNQLAGCLDYRATWINGCRGYRYDGK